MICRNCVGLDQMKKDPSKTENKKNMTNDPYKIDIIWFKWLKESWVFFRKNGARKNPNNTYK